MNLTRTMLAAGLVVLTGVTGAAVPAMAVSESVEPQAVSGAPAIIYYGRTDDGRYFETIPLDAREPANLNVARADKTLPLKTNPQGAITSSSSASAADGGKLFAQCKLYANPVEFDLTLRSMHSWVDQNCDSGIASHWVRTRFDRGNDNGWYPYTGDIWQPAVGDRSYSWFHSAVCHVGAGQFWYAENADGHARLHDGSTIHSPVVVSEIQWGNCGSVA